MKTSELRQSILQVAVQGKLVPQNLHDEPASELLERIRAEKSKLIKEGKIKKEKPLPLVTEDEVPYDLPEGWVWCRLGDLGITQTGTTPSENKQIYLGDYIPFIKPADITNYGIDYFNEGLSEKGLELGRLIIAPAVVMVCIGGSIGKCFYTDKNISCNQQINAITPYFKEMT
ncbi:MAG: restriction endonuclease subunit S, partial [Christensenellaceae bacterium]